jgi:hypothetical protein
MILKYLKIIAEAWKGILAIAGAVTFIAVFAVKIDHWKAQEGETYKSLNEVKTRIDSVLLMVTDIPQMKNDIGNLVTALGNYMIKDSTVTKQDFWNFMRQFQIETEKKNYNYLFMNPQRDSTQQNYTLK